jgi:hypothetical protein
MGYLAGVRNDGPSAEPDIVEPEFYDDWLWGYSEGRSERLRRG